MKFTSAWPVCFSLCLCSVVVVMSGWLIYVSIRIADDMKEYAMGKCGAEGPPLHNNVMLGLLLLGVVVSCSITYALGFTYWSVKMIRKEIVAGAEVMKQKEATEEAERKSMKKSIAVANASHEVRNALVGITALIQMCRAQDVPPSALDQNLKHIESCANDLHSFLNSVLDASKIEAGKMQVEEEEFDLQEVVEDVVDLYYPVGMKKGVDVILDPCDGSVEKYRKVRGDRGKLKQILCNLVYNAIKFTDEGYVSVGARRGSGEGQEYIFEVVDTGKGIPKEKQKWVFENYVQVREEQQQQQLGHGLGLGIVKSLVRLLGGDISIVDKESGERGSCFRFNTFLDCRSGGDDNELTPSAQPPPPSRVVLFLGSEKRRKIAKRFFESHGVKVSVVSEGYQQLGKILNKIKQKLSPHNVLIIIDTSAGPFPEMSRAVSEFLKQGCARYRVVWIQTLPTHNLHLPPTHVLMFKPLQGSRLHYVLGLLFNIESTSSEDSIDVHVLIDKKQQQQQEINDESSQKKPLSGKTMLIVEDNTMLRKICSALLSKLGAVAYTCNNGEEALQMVSKALTTNHQSPFDYILMDCEMPIMDGFEATRRIKEEGKAMGIWIPIIALTAHTGEEEIHRITEAGMDYYLSKPLKAPNLLTAIQHLDGTPET